MTRRAITMVVLGLSSGLTYSIVSAVPGLAAPPDIPTIDANVVNDENNPVPVSIVPPPTMTVICTRDVGSASGGQIVEYGGAAPQTIVECPDSVERIDVQRIGFSPDVGGANSFNVLKYRVTVGFQDALDPPFPFQPSGVLAVVTDGAPQAVIMQDFLLDTTDPGLRIYFNVVMSSGIVDVLPEAAGTIFFIGTPVE